MVQVGHLMENRQISIWRQIGKAVYCGEERGEKDKLWFVNDCVNYYKAAQPSCCRPAIAIMLSCVTSTGIEAIHGS